MNETIPSEDINFVPYTELFPNTVIGGVEVDDNISSPTKTYSSEKIEDRFTETTESLTDAIDDAVDDAVSGIDFSPYEEIDNKNAANGYLGLDAYGQFEMQKVKKGNSFYYYNPLATRKDMDSTLSATNLFSGTLNGGTTFGTLALVEASGTIIQRLALSGSAGNSNVGGVIQLNTGLIKLYSPAKITLTTTIIPILNGTVLPYAFHWGLHTGGLQAIASNSGTGLFIAVNTTLNSGKFTIFRLDANIKTVLFNTNISFTNKAFYTLEIIYDKSTEIAQFFINKVLIHTQTSVNLLASNYYSMYFNWFATTSDTVDKGFIIADVGYGIDNL